MDSDHSTVMDSTAKHNTEVIVGIQQQLSMRSSFTLVMKFYHWEIARFHPRTVFCDANQQATDVLIATTSKIMPSSTIETIDCWNLDRFENSCNWRFRYICDLRYHLIRKYVASLNQLQDITKCIVIAKQVCTNIT